MIKSASQPDGFLGWLESLADPTRLRLLRLMERQELGVAELCDVLQMPQSTVSRHLKLLADLGWAQCRRQGTANFYTAAVDEMDPAAKHLWSLAREQTAHWATTAQDRLRLDRCLNQRQADPQAFFANAAEQWEKMRGELYGESFLCAAVLSLLPSQWVVADLGCGTGQFTAELAGHVRRVIAVDQSAAMLKTARKRTAGMKNVELKKGDMESLPIEGGSCDAAMLLLVLTYVQQPEAALKEAARVVKPGGKLVIVDLLRHDRDGFRRQMGQQWPGFDTAVLEQWLTDAGLVGARCRALPPEPGVKGPALALATAQRPGK